MPYLPTKNSLGRKPIKKYSSHTGGRWSSTGEKRYNTARWKKKRLWFIKRNPACVHCKNKGVFTPATVVDHINPAANEEIDFWEISNWQPLCATCHNIKSSEEGKIKRYGK